MDPMYIAYFEETEELLHKAEECLIKLEHHFSSDDINELFRIAHSIKGSSMMIGYDKIGNLTHKIEDMLDYVRKGQISLDSQILQLCFEGLDYVKKMLESKITRSDEQKDNDVIRASEILGEEIDTILKGQSAGQRHRNETDTQMGIVSILKKKQSMANNRIYISIFFSDDAPMVQALLFMVFNNIKELGTLIYSNISDDDIFATAVDDPVSYCEMILNTDMEASELYPYFEISYVEKVTIVNLSDSRWRDHAVSHDERSLAFFKLFFDEYKKLHPALFANQTINHVKLNKLFREQSVKIRDAASLVPSTAMLQEIKHFYELCLLLLAGKTNSELTNVLRREYMCMFQKVYGYVRGKLIFKIVKARDQHFLERLSEIVERMDRTLVQKLFIDVSGLNKLDEYELQKLVEVKSQLQIQGISLSIIAGAPLNKRLVNIFDSIQSVERFQVFGTELDAVLSE